MIVTKRTGKQVPFDRTKIEVAMTSAFKAVYDDAFSPDMAQFISLVAQNIEDKNIDLTVEQIQDAVVKALLRSDYDEAAEEYIEYRHLHQLARDKYVELMKAVSTKLQATDVKNQNANVDEHSFGGRMGEANSLLMKKYALDYLISPMARANHENNEIYIHDLDHYAVGDHNCFEQSTRFITTLGIKSFEDFADGDSITVLGPDGKWYPATVKYYGKQNVNHYLLKKNKTEKIITATPNHRWLLADGSFQEGLNINDKLLDSPYFWKDFNFDELSPEGKLYWCFGFVYGDGTLETRYSKAQKKYAKTGRTKIKLCGAKAKYLSRFQEVGYGKNCHAEEPEIVGIVYNKTIPDFEKLPLECLISFIHGYYDADGSKSLAPNTNKQIFSMQATGIESCNFIEQYFAVAGLYINSIKDKTNQKTNFGIRGYTKNYQFFAEPSSKYQWYVKDIKREQNSLQDVWCLQVEEIHAFVLEGGIPTGNCLSIPFDDLLANGFSVRQTDIRPAQTLSTALQLVAVIFQVQSLQQFGGVSATHLDWTLVPYVRKSFRKHYIDGLKYIENIIDEELFNHIPKDAGITDYEYKIYQKVYQYAMDMTERECYQSIEGLYHNLNSLQSRSGNQLPFTSINYGTCTLPEGRMVIKALLDVSIKGIGKLHRTSIFPCGIFQCMKGVNRAPGDSNYDLFRLALESTSQRLYPNYANVDWSGNAGYNLDDPKTYFSTMGCRTSNGYDINGLGQQKDGRGNICPVTIIMPTLAMEAVTLNSNDDWNDYKSLPQEERAKIGVERFITLLDTKINEAKDMLLERFDWICSQSPDSAKFMYENNVMAEYVPEEGIRSALKHGTIVIGQIGLAETLQILIGCDHTKSEGMELAKRIEQLFKDRCAEFKQQYKLNFGVYYTPAENLCYTSMQKFKAKYGEIPNVSDKEFFTNSIHVPVWKQITPFEKIDIESQLTGYSNAGCITYVEIDSNGKNNIDALETIVNYAMDKDIPYFAINAPNDQCMDCGYTDLMDKECLECGGHNILHLRRVTGYLTNDYLTAFNPGKVQEVQMRVQHARFPR